MINSNSITSTSQATPSEISVYTRPLGASGRSIPAAPLSDGRNSINLVPNTAKDSFYFRELEQQGLHLNEPQIAAVRHGEGPLLTLAGAGSGKTSVLVSRTGYLIRVHNIDPRSILLVTFSVKAAGEMKERISTLPGISPAQASAVTARTFHSFFLQLLRSRGYKQEVLGNARPQGVLKAMLREMGLKDDIQPETALSVLSDAKLNGDGVAELPENSAAERSMKALLLRYEEWKEHSGSMDFDDILLWSGQLLKDRPELLSMLQKRFRYVMIDEFQDTSRLQYELIRMLSGGHGNLMAVGDDDQTIYGFNGARSDYMLGFQEAFPGAKMVTLDINYRSAASIVGLGNEIIRHNANRYPKSLQAYNSKDTLPKYMTPGSTDQEAEAVTAHIRTKVEEGARLYKDFAILYRTANSARAMFEALVMSGIPFLYSEGGELFYEQSSVKPLLDHLRLSLNRRNFTAMEGMVQTLYVNRQQAINHIRALDAPRPKKGPLIHLVSLQGLKEFQQQKIRDRIKAIKTLKEMKPLDAIRWMRRDFYDAFLDTEGQMPETAQKETVKEALDELEASAGRFTDVTAFITFIDSLITRHAQLKETKQQQEEDAVKLMTIHKSKGLEFPAVILIGACESILPHKLALEADKLADYEPGVTAAQKRLDALEEERRLAYVAVTRAKEELLISSPAYYRGRKTEVSRFIQAAFGLEYKEKSISTR